MLLSPMMAKLRHRVSSYKTPLLPHMLSRPKQPCSNKDEKVGGDERVQASLIPTVSTHKRPMEQRVDGYILAVVK